MLTVNAHYAERHYAECHNAHYAERHYTECRYAKSRGALLLADMKG
jgi:hypothetical protein